MTLDWAHFTPWTSLGGGLLIGLAAALLILANGRIAGISGIVGGVLHAPAPGDVAWRLAFAAGLVAAPAIHSRVADLPPATVDAGLPALIVAGLFVGFGSRLGSGCTSGHGVCGISRLSPRSLIATATFMATGFATVFVMRHTVGWPQ